MDKKFVSYPSCDPRTPQAPGAGRNSPVVHRTPRHIYAQVIAPNGSEVLVAASTVEKLSQNN